MHDIVLFDRLMINLCTPFPIMSQTRRNKFSAEFDKFNRYSLIFHINEILPVYYQSLTFKFFGFTESNCAETRVY